jgi:hypothetical protein
LPTQKKTKLAFGELSFFLESNEIHFELQRREAFDPKSLSYKSKKKSNNNLFDFFDLNCYAKKRIYLTNYVQ